MNAIQTQDITGLVLAGGRGSRMGGADKGLQPFHGVPLAWHAAQRLQPQVGPVLLNANRNLADYAAWGLPVHADSEDGTSEFAGPLSGVLAGLRHCATPYLVTVPCDSPLFPPDLVLRLAAAMAQGQADIAMAASIEPDDPQRQLRLQPVFCLLRAGLRDSLSNFLNSGGRRVHSWTAQHKTVLVPFTGPQDDALAFANANTLDELQRLAAQG